MSVRSRHSMATPAPRLRQTAATPGSARTASANQLPPYESPAFSLNPAAQRALAALTQTASLKRLDKQFAEAQAAVSNDAAEINDRLTARETAVGKEQARKRKADGDGSQELEGSQQRGVQDLTELRDKVDRMTQRMDESMRKIIDGQHSVEFMRESMATVAEEARANASTQASTQQVRTQRRTRRNAGSGGEDGEDGGEEDEYRAFTPTDPSNATQTPHSTLDAFRTKMDTAKLRYQSHSHAARYADNSDYTAFRQVVFDARHPDGDIQMPHPTSWFPEGDVPAPGITARGPATANANADDDDDDIAIERATISTKCPLTLQEFRHPLSSKKCSHSFEAEAIMEMLRNSPTRGSVQCPVPGCKEVLAKVDLHTDAVLKRKIKRLQEARHREEEDEDEEEGGDGRGRTQRNATLIADDEEEADGAEIDTLIARQTQMKTEPAGTARSAPRPAEVVRSTAPIDLGDSSEDEEQDDGGEEEEEEGDEEEDDEQE